MGRTRCLSRRGHPKWHPDKIIDWRVELVADTDVRIAPGLPYSSAGNDRLKTVDDMTDGERAAGSEYFWASKGRADTTGDSSEVR